MSYNFYFLLSSSSYFWFANWKIDFQRCHTFLFWFLTSSIHMFLVKPEWFVVHSFWFIFWNGKSKINRIEKYSNNRRVMLSNWACYFWNWQKWNTFNHHRVMKPLDPNIIHKHLLFFDWFRSCTFLHLL